MLRRSVCMSAGVVGLAVVHTALAGPVLEIDAGSMGEPRGGIVVDQQPTIVAGGPSSDTAFFELIGLPETWQLLADNIQVNESATVRQVTWWGFYGGNFGGSTDPPVGDEYMRVRFYAPRPGDGLPDSSSILFEETFLNATRTATGRVIFGGSPEFRYQANLGSSFLLAANARYWLEIAQLGDVDSTFRWEYAFGVIAGHAFANPAVPDWQFVNSSLAFQLSSVPEPNAAMLMLLGSSLALRRTRSLRRSQSRLQRISAC